jgi:hypothetical protein
MSRAFLFFGQENIMKLIYKFTVLVFSVLVVIFAGPAFASDHEHPFSDWPFGHVLWEDESTTAYTHALVKGHLDRGIPVDAVIIPLPKEPDCRPFFDDQKTHKSSQKCIVPGRDKTLKDGACGFFEGPRL